MQQKANILEQPIFPQTSPRKNRKRPYSLVLFIPVGAGTVPACTRKKINQKYLQLRIFRRDFRIYVLYTQVFFEKYPRK